MNQNVARSHRFCVALLLGCMPMLAGAQRVAQPYTYDHHVVSTPVAAAQAAFDRGLTLVYAYSDTEAELSFREAARLDPGLAMAWWGIALALGPDINTAPDPGRTVVAAKAIVRARQLAAARSTAVERDYIDALAARYSVDPTPDFDALALAYRERARALVRKYPRDPVAATLFAEAAMDLRPWRLWSPEGVPAEGTPELVSVLEAGLRAHPRHIGLMHLYIHAVEASNDPGRALGQARQLAALPFEPAAGHLVHMPAHIFLRVGDWSAAVRANEHAAHHALDFRRSNEPEADHACSHCAGFLLYAYAMQANLAGARRAAALLESASSQPTARIGMLARFRLYDELLAVPEPGGDPASDDGAPRRALARWHYGRAIAHLGRSELDAAEAELAALRTGTADVPPEPHDRDDRLDVLHAQDRINAEGEAAIAGIAERLVAGRLALARGDSAHALEQLRAAVDIQEKAGYDEPPLWLYPARETLAAALLKTGAPGEAVAVLRASLTRTPHNPRALVGLRQALRSAQPGADTRALDAEIAAAQLNADVPLSFEML